jgi:hypothetical protein
MSPAVAERRPWALEQPDHRRQGSEALRRLATARGGRLTLERRLGEAWEGLAADGVAECPLCRGSMVRPAGAAGPARCEGCGSTLS